MQMTKPCSSTVSITPLNKHTCPSLAQFQRFTTPLSTFSQDVPASYHPLTRISTTQKTPIIYSKIIADLVVDTFSKGQQWTSWLDVRYPSFRSSKYPRFPTDSSRQLHATTGTLKKLIGLWYVTRRPKIRSRCEIIVFCIRFLSFSFATCCSKVSKTFKYIQQIEICGGKVIYIQLPRKGSVKWTSLPQATIQLRSEYFEEGIRIFNFLISGLNW